MQGKIRDLIDFLNLHTKAYDEGHSLISDAEWDDKYFELKQLEEETGLIYPDSPTQTVVYVCKNELNKVSHNHPMLSLDKTKSVDEVDKFLGSKDAIGMCKMDGLTCSLRYVDGKLVGAETRGNGIVGEDILHNARVIKSIPQEINYREELIVDGEIICTYSDFEKWSDTYKNPRNFASGSIRLLDSRVCADRGLTFVAWDVITGFETCDQLDDRLLKLASLGFTVVPFGAGDAEMLIESLKKMASELSYPIDGVVFKFNSKAYGDSLDRTEHHFKNAIAYKFYDETYETELLDIDWTMGRTGILTPVAVFAPIDIEGTEVERASLHNVSISREILGELPYRGQKVNVYKANMIVPQVYSAEKNANPENIIECPRVCPICKHETKLLKSEGGVYNLHCVNPTCEGKLINRLDHFIGKKGLDIKGLSVATLEKLIDKGWLYSLDSVFELKEHRAEWIRMDGFGPKSVDKILVAIEQSRKPTLEKFISSLGIPLIGVAVAKELVKTFKTYEDFRNAVKTRYNFSYLDGFAESKTYALWSYNYDEADKVFEYLDIPEVEEKSGSTNSLNGLNIVITGKLVQYKNRAALQADIEAAGGKVVGSVSAKTNYLINNDNTSTSSKNLAAQKLGIEILTEQEFIKKFLE